MMKRVAAGPIDKMDIGIGALASVEIVAATWMQQAIGDARRRDRTRQRIAECLHDRRAESQWWLGNAARRAIAETEPSPGQADLAKTSRQQDQRPIGLLAVIGALQGPGSGDHGARRRHAASKLSDGVTRDAG